MKKIIRFERKTQLLPAWTVESRRVSDSDEGIWEEKEESQSWENCMKARLHKKHIGDGG